MARSLLRIPAIVIVVLIFAYAGLSAWAIVAAIGPKVERTLDSVTRRYDEVMPKITIRNGKAYAEGPQPHIVRPEGKKGEALVIDTRPDRQDKLLDYFKEGNVVAVLGHEQFMYKNNARVQIYYLKSFPDIVIDTNHLKRLKAEFWPTIEAGAGIALGVYYLLSKTVQMLLLALIAYIVAQAAKAPLSYGGACKLAVLAMLPAVAVDILLDSLGLGLGLQVGAYAIVLLVALGLLIWSFVSAERKPSDPYAAITP